MKVEEKGIDTRDSTGSTDIGRKPAAVCKPTAISECLKGNNVYDLDQTKHIEKP